MVFQPFLFQLFVELVHAFRDDQAGPGGLLGQKIPHRPADRTGHADQVAPPLDNGELAVDRPDAGRVARGHRLGRLGRGHVEQHVLVRIDQIHQPFHVREFLHGRPLLGVWENVRGSASGTRHGVPAAAAQPSQLCWSKRDAGSTAVNASHYVADLENGSSDLLYRTPGTPRNGCIHSPDRRFLLQFPLPLWINNGRVMRQYLDLMQWVLDHGSPKTDRTGTGTLSIFGHQLRFDLQQGFPLVTTKKLHLKSIIYELLWFLRGETNTRYLKEHGVSIWDEWADERGDLGPIYGHQWRSWATSDGGTVDQVSQLIERIHANPDSRRLIVSAWNVGDLSKMALPPCHLMFQFYVADGRLSCQLYQRSADIFLGVPFNIASYALLTMMVAQVTGLQPGEFIHTFGDAHLYQNHMQQARLQLSREPRSLPKMRINPQVGSIFDFQFDDFQLEDYHPHPHIRAPVAV